MKVRVRIEGRDFAVEVGDLTSRPVRVTVDGKAYEVWPEQAEARTGTPPSPAPARSPGGPPRPSPGPDRAAAGMAVRAPIPGVILSVGVKAGERVDRGQELCVLEAMKMKNAIRASRDGMVAVVHVAPGQHVKHNDLLLEFVG